MADMHHLGEISGTLDFEIRSWLLLLFDVIIKITAEQLPTIDHSHRRSAALLLLLLHLCIILTIQFVVHLMPHTNMVHALTHKCIEHHGV